MDHHSEHKKTSMSKKRIGALIIGQSPRLDLVAPLEQLLPDFEILQAGALDDVRRDDLTGVTKAAYPLVTRMQNGDAVMVEESFIAPRLQQALTRVETKDAVATILLCAGTFADLHAKKPLFKPFDIGYSVLRALNIKTVGLITPIVEQEVPICQRWKSVGLQPFVWTADLGKQDKVFQQQLIEYVHKYGLESIVLDYVGHPIDQVRQLQASIDLPVFDLGYLAMVTLASTLKFA